MKAKQFSKQIGIGKFVKIINPEIDPNGQKCIVVGEKSMIIPTRRLKELDDFQMKSGTTCNAQACPTLSMIAKLDPNDKVPMIRVIVLKDLGINLVGRSDIPVKKLIVKDKEGTENAISVWSYFIEQVELGKVYQITNMRVEKYPMDKPHQISTTGASKITDISEEAKEEFKNVSLADGILSGHVEVIHKVYKYDCCPKCRCKVDDSMLRCATCNAVLNERSQTFKYELCLNLEKDEILYITGFSPSVANVIDQPLPSTDEIEEKLNDVFEGKLVEVQYTTNRKNLEKIAYRVNIKN